MPESNIEHSGTPPLDMATTEHIFSKWDIRRALSKKVVLCCFECNRDKNKEDMLKAWGGYDSYKLVAGISIFDLIEYIK